jgi:hypothetical protein
MMASEPDHPKRREAEDRITLRFDRQTKALSEFQRQESERHAQAQHHLLDDSVERQSNFEAAKEQRLAAHKQRWEQAKDRLAHKPVPVLAFDMMGGPPSRNLARDHDEMLRNWTAQRDQIVKDFDQRIADCEATRTEMLKGFWHANEALEQRHGEDRRALAERQQQSFEGLVGKELDRSHDWVSDKFKQRSRNDNERDE